ncbi:MAG: hypothetical protein KGO96_12845 [Elusimicrobia bacterium]|nr:hypothetical protein [Elusimicrobiota bacterium]
MAATYFEQALQNFIVGLAAVQATWPSIPVRVMKLAQDDALPAIIVGPHEEMHENDLSGRGGAVEWKGLIRVTSKVFADVRLITEAIRNNGTSPGTGLAGYSGTMDGWSVQRVSVEKSTFDFIWYEDATDEGDFVMDTEIEVAFAEAV